MASVELEEPIQRAGQVRRVDALEKALGETKYTTDNVQQDALYLRVVRSPHPHALISQIDTSKAEHVQGVVRVLTAKHVPGSNYIGYVVQDRPLLCHDKVRFVGDQVALVVADTPESAELGVQAVDVHYDRLPAVFEPGDALKPGAPPIHPSGNLTASHFVRLGDVVKGLAMAGHVVKGVYTTPVQEQAYLETEAALAYPKAGGVVVLGSMQNPFMVKKAVSTVLGGGVPNVRIIQAPTGGGFGGKQDAPDEVCAMAALGAWLTKRPALLAFSRKESTSFHPKRHPMIFEREMGVTSEGKITAVRARILADGGAYASLSERVLFVAVVVAAGPYNVPNVSIDGTAVYTNNVPTGAFRGFGKPQASFAAELQMDEAAGEIGMDPAEFRLKNVLRAGSTAPTGQTLPEGIGIEECILKARAASDWDAKRRAGPGSGTKRRGIGMACTIHPEGLNGEADAATAWVEIDADGQVVVKTGLTEYGQGIYTGFTRIVSKVLGVAADRVSVIFPDTDLVPDSGPTVASRSTVFGGKAILLAAERLRERLAAVAAEMLSCPSSDLAFEGDSVSRKGRGNDRLDFDELVSECRKRGMKLREEGRVTKALPLWDMKAGRGDLAPSYAFAAHVAEVEVDTETGKVDVINYTAAHDSGAVVAREQYESQIVGGVAQGLGYALMEELILKEGVIRNQTFLDYHIPTAADIPSIKTIIVEAPDDFGPFGAKGVGEAGIEPVAGAVSNAVYNALGFPIRRFPFTPERVSEAIEGRAKRP
ncbi:MAG TPA: xanthine dehydrogenase family protein molybdopterin-binding subunit [Nitrososphaerales archaeon]|nr:xanthine dehydrogenase family protein molybdopterin-binding subunit [Nitrososphaerales archaeon]